MQRCLLAHAQRVPASPCRNKDLIAHNDEKRLASLPDDFAATKDHGERLTLQPPARSQANVAGDTVQVDRFLAAGQQQGDTAGIDAERVETLKPVLQPFRTRIDHDGRVVALHQPGHLEQPYAFQVGVSDRVRPPRVHQGGRVNGQMPGQVGTDEPGISRFRTQEHQLRPGSNQLLTQRRQVGVMVHLLQAGNAPTRGQPFFREGLADASSQCASGLHDHRMLEPGGRASTRRQSRFSLGGKSKRIKPRGKRSVAFGHVEGHGRYGRRCLTCQGGYGIPRHRADNDGGAAFNGTQIGGDHIRGVAVGSAQLHGEPRRVGGLQGRATTGRHCLRRAAEIRRIDRQDQRKEGAASFTRLCACRIVGRNAQCRPPCQQGQCKEAGSAMRAEHGGERDGALYVVATPIGNLEDITLRALRTLTEADVIAAEDTRIASRLLSHHGITRRPVSLHEHNERAMAKRVLAWLGEGKRVAMITDAGTPGISDPGAFVVQEARAAGYAVIPIPGPSALAAALSVSGPVGERILFCGFLPAAREARRKAIGELAPLPWAMVLYEAPHRVLQCVEDLAEGLAPAGERRIVIARELTKMFETLHECALDQAAAWLLADPNRKRGEFVLIVTGSRIAAQAAPWEGLLQSLLEELPLAQAVRLTCAATGARRKAVYERALAIAANVEPGNGL
jgi:16S rRNA (cytidine1402-2'-O)-methyltransferase